MQYFLCKLKDKESHSQNARSAQPKEWALQEFQLESLCSIQNHSEQCDMRLLLSSTVIRSICWCQAKALINLIRCYKQEILSTHITHITTHITSLLPTLPLLSNKRYPFKFKKATQRPTLTPIFYYAEIDVPMNFKVEYRVVQREGRLWSTLLSTAAERKYYHLNCCTCEVL